MHQLKKVPVLI